jgi:L-cysteate sulfo-lyase
VVGISADESAASLESTERGLLAGLAKLLDCDPDRFASAPVAVDDGFVGEGYGMPTMASREAVDLAARTEALFVDHTYTAKALAGLIARVRSGLFNERSTVLFWHTGGQVGLFA